MALATMLSAAGLICDIVGVILMARPYLQFLDSTRSVVFLLWSGLWGTDLAKGAQRVAGKQPADQLAKRTFVPALRGLALLLIGFVLQTAGLLLSAANSPVAG